jgi:N-acetylglucosaminyldiphosphoundecaprenol N-acetyl-beta-D-mannosaminyltransferase
VIQRQKFHVTLTQERILETAQRPGLTLLGTTVHKIDRPLLQAEIVACVRNRAHALVLNVNVQCLNLCYEQPPLRTFMNSADIVFCDGFGVRLAARLLGHRLPPRITYADWIWELAAFSAAENLSLYFLGARPDVAARAATVLQARFPDLTIAGVQHGYFDLTPGSRENDAVVAAINEVTPDILLIGFGMPRQEYWLRDNWPAIDSRVALTGGAIFDYVAGDLRRAPRWMTDHGLEWLGRLFIEPRRLWRRYVLGNPRFFWRLLRERLHTALRSS